MQVFLDEWRRGESKWTPLFPWKMTLIAANANTVYVATGGMVTGWTLGDMRLEDASSVMNVHIGSVRGAEINKVVLGYLGDKEVLVVVDEEGVGRIYFTDAVQRPLEFKLFLVLRHYLKWIRTDLSAWGIDVCQPDRLVAISNNSHQIYVYNVGCLDERIRKRDGKDDEHGFLGTERARILRGHRHNIPDVAFSIYPNAEYGRLLYSASIDRTVRMWSLEKDVCLASRRLGGWCWQVKPIDVKDVHLANDEAFKVGLQSVWKTASNRPLEEQCSRYVAPTHVGSEEFLREMGAEEILTQPNEEEEDEYDGIVRVDFDVASEPDTSMDSIGYESTQGFLMIDFSAQDADDTSSEEEEERETCDILSDDTCSELLLVTTGQNIYALDPRPGRNLPILDRIDILLGPKIARTDVPFYLVSFHRLCMLQWLPKLSVAVVATQVGYAAIVHIRRTIAKPVILQTIGFIPKKQDAPPVPLSGLYSQDKSSDDLIRYLVGMVYLDGTLVQVQLTLGVPQTEPP